MGRVEALVLHRVRPDVAGGPQGVSMLKGVRMSAVGHTSRQKPNVRQVDGVCEQCREPSNAIDVRLEQIFIGIVEPATRLERVTC